MMTGPYIGPTTLWPWNESWIWKNIR